MSRTSDIAAIIRPCLAVLPAGVASVLCSFSATAADAPEDVNTFEITPFVGQMGGGTFEDAIDGSDRDVQNDTNVGLFFNINADNTPERQYEFIYTKQSTEIEGTVPIDMDIQYLHIGGIVNFTDARHAIPFFGMTVGATQFSPGASGLDDETKLSFSAGGGVKIPITHHFGIRFDARAFVSLLDSDGNIFCVSTAAGSGCAIKAKSDSFIQYTATLGFIAAF
ncbi:MAG TPA: outer membrane beta-barrel protein [Povalibacter sp.]